MIEMMPRISCHTDYQKLTSKLKERSEEWWIRSLVDSARQKRSKSLHNRSPISLLPVEILGYIFLVGTSEDPTKFPILVSHVSRHWRNTAIQNARLWRYIELSDRTPVAKTRTWIERSKECQLDITIRSKVPYIRPGGIDGMMNILLPHIARCRDFSVSVKDARDMFTVLRRLQSDPRNLERLRLVSKDGILVMPGFDPTLPRLKSLELARVSLSRSCTMFRDLKELRLTFDATDEGGWPSLNDIGYLLNSNPCLEVFHLENVGFRAQEDLQAVPVHLPALHTLELWHVNSVMITAILSSIKAPALETLQLRPTRIEKLVLVEGSFLRQLLTLILPNDNARPTVTKFQAYRLAFKDVGFADLLRRLPRLETLSLTRCAIPEEVPLNHVKDICPCLHHLDVNSTLVVESRLIF